MCDLNTQPCEVGKYYMVKCVRLVNQNLAHDFRGWVPVIGPEHEDAKYIGFKPTHFHVDWRFASGELWRSRGGNYNALRALGSVLNTSSREGEKREYEVSTRKLKCKRPPPTWPAGKLEALHEAYADCPLKPGHVCPHKGIHLDPFADEDGIAICPGHGLVWNLRENRLATPDEEDRARKLLESI